MKFIDSVKIYVKAGDGGQGCVSFRREKFIEFGGPDGGNGGHGGNVYIKSVLSYNNLIDFRYKQHFKAPKGKNGAGKNRTGEKGKDLIIEVPVGSIIFNEDKSEMIYDFNKADEQILLCQAGIGGRGNASFKTSTNRAPKFAQKGTEGQECWIWIELEIIADVGIIGMPNAGKSTLITKITNSKSKIGNYAFTTLMPNLGVLSYEDKQITLADLPGLVENASKGVGLGTKFLSHINRCKAFLHVIDVSNKNIIDNYKIILNELVSFNKDTLKKKQIIVLNKIDLISEEELKSLIKELRKISNDNIISISALENENLNNLVNTIIKEFNDTNQSNKNDKKKKWSPY